MDKRFTVEQMKSALLATRSKMSKPQESMLRAHYLYRTLSMERIAKFGGYGGFRAGNLQYGALCGRIARQLGFTPHGEKTSTIATVSEKLDKKGHYQWRMDDVVVKALEGAGCFSQIVEEKPEPRESREITKTERKALIKARVGQGVFRTDLVALWGSCAVTGCTLSKVLIASHIGPWKHATNRERLDPFNGLLLTPNLDKLVEHLFISFNDDGSILISKDLDPKAKALLGINKKSRLRFVRPANLPYLRRHRRLFLERD